PLSQRMQLRYERGALADLEQIFSYIVQDNPKAAAKLVARIEETAACIARILTSERQREKSQFRQFPVGSYLIVYEIGYEDVVIHYVRHGARRRPWEE